MDNEASKRSKTIQIDITPDELRRLQTRKGARKVKITSHRRYRLRTPSAPAAKGADNSRADDRYEQLFQGLYDAIIITDTEGRIRDANHRATEFLLYNLDEFRTMSVLELFFNSDTNLLPRIASHLESQRHVLLESFCIRRDASMFAADVAVNRLVFDEPLLCFLLRDVTERRQAQTELRIQHEAVKNSANGIAIVALDGGIQYVNPAGVSMWAYDSEAEMKALNIADLWADTDELSDLLDALHEEPVPWFGELIGSKKDGEQMEVLASVTCIQNDDGELVGTVFSLVDISERKQARRELEMYRDNLEVLVEERTREIEETQLEIIRRLGQAAEQRHEDTSTHIARVNYSCYVLARAAGLPQAQCELLFEAAAMHDVGKVGVADAILMKPGPLTPEEYEAMKSHTTLGAELLSGLDSPLFKMAKSIALTHHERWDGTGYPRGLAGEEIPIEGRILAICDVFDALITARCYKKAWPIDKAVEEIKAQKGTFFEPDLVEIFVENLQTILSVRDNAEALEKETTADVSTLE